MIMHSHQKLWLDLEGNLIPIPESHEEYANSIGYELEDLQADGWVRIQITPAYLYLDFHLPLNTHQAEAVGRLFEGRFSVYVVEFRGMVREFGDGDEALKHVQGVK
jgi:hypothetical protein